MEDDELLAFDLEGVERKAAQQKQLSDQQRQPGCSAGEVQDHVPGLQQFAYSRADGQENRPAAAPPVREGQHSYAVHIPTAADLLKASVPRQNGLSCSHAGRTDPYYQEQQPHGQQACQPPQEQAPQTLPHWPPQQQWHHNPLLATAHQGVPGRSAGQHNGDGSAGLQGHQQEHKLQPWLLPPQHQQHPPPAHTQQQASQQQQHRPSWNQQQFGQMQHNRQQQYPNPHRPQHQQHPGGMPPQVNWQQRLQQQQQERLERLGPAAQLPIIPRCPYKRCPGIFSQCGAVLRWIERRSHNFWSCSRYPHCEYKYFPAQQLPHAELGCEVVDSKHFKLAPQPAAEVAVRRAGGIRAVLAAANIQFAHLEIAQQHQQQEGGDSGAEASAPAADADADADAERSGSSGSSGSSGAGVDDLASGPMWDWSADESLLLPLCQYEVVESVLRSCRPPLLGRGGAIPQATLAAFREPEARLASEAEVSARFDAMPASLRQALMPFQREGVLYGLTRHGRVLIADEMGVGKTVQALALAACYQEEWPLLVVVPASLRLVWAEEIERWLPHIRPGDVTVIEGKDDRLNDLPDAVRRVELPAITITSYEMMKRLSCPACQKLQGAAAAAAAKAAKARQAEAAACNSTAAAAASEAATGDGSNPGGTAAAAQACGGRGSGGGARGRGRGRGRAQMAAAPVQDSVVTGSKEVVWDVSETGGCSGAGDRPGGRAGKRCHGCTGPDHCMAALPWGVVIIDESHNLRTTNSRQADSPQTEAAVAAASAAPRVILLSGTPSLSRPYDLFRQVDVLQPGILGRAKEDFAHRYCDRRLVPVRNARAGPGPGGEPRLRWNNAGGGRLVELHGLLVRRVMVRRLKKDVLTQLPPKRRQVIRLPHPPAHRWPKEETQAEQQQQQGDAEQQQQQQQQQQDGEQQDDQQQGQVEGAGNAVSDEITAAGSMTAAHRVALAKLPDAIEWLMAALGRSQPGREQQQDGGRGSGKQGAPHDPCLAGPGKAPSGRLKPLWQGGSSAGCNSSGGGGGGISRASSGHGSVDAAAGVAGQEEDEEGDEEQQEGQSGQQSGGTGPKFLVFAHHKDVMDKLAAALAGYGSHLPDGSTAAAPNRTNHPALDPDLAVEVARQAARGCSSAVSAGSSVVRQGWRGVEYVRVDGSHDSAERHAAVKRFKSDPSCRVALLSITAAAVGLDFSAASMVVFVELPHEVSLVRQAEDRAHRKGQAAKAVNVYFLCAQGTVDDKHWQALNLSLAHISAVHDGEVLPQPLARATARAPAAAAAPAGEGDGDEEACGEASRDAAGTDGAACAEGIGEGAAGTSEADAAAAAAAPSAAGAGVVKAGAAAAAEGCRTQQPGASGVSTAAALAAAAEAGEDAQQGVVDLTADSPVKPPNSSPKQPSPHRFRPLTLTPYPNGKALQGGTRQPSPGTPSAAAAVATADVRDAAAAAAASPGSAQAAPGAPERQEGFEQDGALVPTPALQQLAAATAPRVLQPCSDQNLGAGGMCLSPVAPEVWFEVSKHTNRLHYHLSADGSRPLGLNIPLESLLLPEEGTLQQLAAAWNAAWQEELKKRQQQQPLQVQPLPAIGQAQQSSSQQQAVSGGCGGVGGVGGSQAKVASPFFGRQSHQQTVHQQQQQGEGAMEVVRHTQEAQQQHLQQQVAQTPAAPACAAAAAATPAPGSALGFAALASGGAAASHATPAAPAVCVSQVPVSTSSRGRPIPALESLRSLMPFEQSAAAPPAAAVGCASVGASVQAGPVDTAVLAVASSHATPSVAANADVQVVSATPSPTAALAAAGAAATSHQHIAGGSSQQQQEDAANGTAGMQQHASSAAPTCSQGMVQSLPGLMQRMRRLLSQPGSQQQHEEERRAHAEHSPDPAAVTEQQERQQYFPQQEPQQQDDDDAAVGSPAGLVLHLDDSAEQQPAAAVSNDVIVIPASQDTYNGLDSQQQEQQAVQHVDLLSHSPLGKVPQHHSLQQEQRAEAAESRQQQPPQQEQQLLLVPATGLSGLPDCRSAPGFLSPSGLACLTLPLSPLALLELLRQGAAFAADWSELRSVTRNRLVGRVLPPDLASAVEAATAAAASAGAFGVGTTRYLQDIQEGDPNLPSGARLTNVAVHYPNGRQQLVTYRQAFTGGGADGSPLVRHCINCFKDVEGAVAAEDAVLQGSLDLFCSLECERSWSIKSSSGGIRRALFKLERGVCQLCHLDCHALVAQLQQIAKDSPHWLQHRRAVVAALAPKMLERGYGTLLDRLLNQATEGNAWHADHIVAVYEGGGGCELDNLRTLCVACHAAVTKKQAAARAAERQRRKLGTADIRLFFCGLPVADSIGAGGLAAVKPRAGLKRKRRAKVKGSGAGCVDDLSTPEEEGDKVQPRTAAGSAAGAQDMPAGAGPQGKPAAAAGSRGKPAATAATGKKRGRPPKKQKGASKAAAASDSKASGQIQKWVASAAAAPQGPRAHMPQPEPTAAAAPAAAGGVTRNQPDEDAVIELLDDSQPGLEGASPTAPDSAAAALDSTPQSQRRPVKRPAAAAAEASAAGHGLAGLRTVLDQFRFSQEDGSSQGQGARGLRGSRQQLSTQPSQQRQQRQQGKKRKAPSKPAANKRRTVGRDRKQQGRLDSSDDGSDGGWSDGAG